ncbi:MAG: hypothetical protein LBR43_01205 [Spiroplasmataceae bacterium]|nr:hypothetical protein [Spiroplasmataceae bacterium]
MLILYISFIYRIYDDDDNELYKECQFVLLSFRLINKPFGQCKKYVHLKNEFTFKGVKTPDMKGFADLFVSSQVSGKLANFTLTDFGSQIQKAKLSFGQVNLGIYKQGSRNKFSKPIFHKQEEGFHEIISQLKYKGHYYASLRNFNSGIIMNFTHEDFARGLYFSTWTFNNFKQDLKFTFGYGSNHGANKCSYQDCQKSHFYQTVPTEISSFLAEKKTAKKQLGRELEGVNDLFAKAIQLIQKEWQPTNFKWVAVPELHKCQRNCHWQGQKKSNKVSWKNHNENYCQCQTKHECLRNWHIHMISTDFLPEKYRHDRCGLGKFTDAGNPQGCWNHRGFIAHDIWPYGLVDMKRISHLKMSGQAIRTSERAIAYLTKYLAKSFQMRENQELAQKVGLLKGMGVYKFFRVIYGYKENQAFIQAKRKKPAITSYAFINNDLVYPEEIEQEFGAYFEPDLKLKKQAKLILKNKDKSINSPPNRPKINDILKLCLNYCSNSNIKKNGLWKPCVVEEYDSKCHMTKEHHCDQIIRWDFHFSGVKAYSDFQDHILPYLSQIRFPSFTKFSNFQPQDLDYIKFAHQAKLPWNREIYPYSLDEMAEITEEWKADIPLELIYNYIYLKEIRSQISCKSQSWGLSAEKSAQRYADY